MATPTGVATEPTIRSTLSSVVKRRAMRTPLVGSVASSRMVTCSFSPAMLVGQSSIWFLAGMPRPEAGPVRGRITPILMSACAAVATIAAAAAAIRVLKAFMVLSPWLGLKAGEGNSVLSI